MTTASREQDGALEVYHKLLACQRFDDVAGGVLQPLADHLSAETASFRQFHFSGDQLAIGHNCCHRVAHQSHSQYTSYFHQMDPVLRYGMRQGGRLGSISRFGFDLFRLADICDYKSLTQTEYYQDFFRPNHIHHVLVLAFRLFGNRDQVALLGFHRPSDAPGFSRQDLRRARQAAPALLSTLHGMTLENALRRKRAIVDSLEFAARDVGVALLDQSFSVLYANHRGRTVLGLAEEDECVDSAGDHAVLEEIKNLCQQTDWSAPEVMRDGRRITLVNKDRRGGDESGDLVLHVQLHMRDEGGNAFFIKTCQDGHEDQLDTRLERSGMTHREKDIARLIARGQSNQGISDTLCISVRTTENHLRSIFSKVGVNTRSQLIFRLYTNS
ncbi:MAG: helix-turn-helix transcriptional regulator [Alphaproteobacteria bacterium]|nr:helix-turn-helix transcriptional regulator [Alphaproteobacteria bacterium]